MAPPPHKERGSGTAEEGDNGRGSRRDTSSVAAAAARIWLSAISQPQADASRINLATASSGFFPFMKAYVSHLSGSGTFFFLSLFSLVY